MGIVAATGEAVGDDLDDTEDLVGGGFNDNLYGRDAEANALYGLAGNDRLDGRSGSDVLAGGARRRHPGRRARQRHRLLCRDRGPVECSCLWPCEHRQNTISAASTSCRYREPHRQAFGTTASSERRDANDLAAAAAMTASTAAAGPTPCGGGAATTPWRAAAATTGSAAAAGATWRYYAALAGGPRLRPEDHDRDRRRGSRPAHPVEGAIGGDAGDRLAGDGRNNELPVGGLGADTLIGRNGDDMLNGGGGADRLFGGDGFDVYVFIAGQATATHHRLRRQRRGGGRRDPVRRLRASFRSPTSAAASGR